jgi:hypothetical protein
VVGLPKMETRTNAMLLCTKVSRMFTSISKTRAITILLAESLEKLFLTNLDKMNMSDYNRESHTPDAPLLSIVL